MALFLPLNFFREMSILLRSTDLVLLSIGTCMSTMVLSGDIILLFFYVGNRLGATDRDMAGVMLGVLFQAGFLT